MLQQFDSLVLSPKKRPPFRRVDRGISGIGGGTRFRCSIFTPLLFYPAFLYSTPYSKSHRPPLACSSLSSKPVVVSKRSGSRRMEISNSKRKQSWEIRKLSIPAIAISPLRNPNSKPVRYPITSSSNQAVVSTLGRFEGRITLFRVEGREKGNGNRKKEGRFWSSFARSPAKLNCNQRMEVVEDDVAADTIKSIFSRGKGVVAEGVGVKWHDIQPRLFTHSTLDHEYSDKL